jgi:hypothetical protein
MLNKFKNYELDIYDIIYEIVFNDYIKYKKKLKRIKQNISKFFILNSKQEEIWMLCQELIEKMIEKNYYYYIKYKRYRNNIPYMQLINGIEKKIFKRKFPMEMIINLKNNFIFILKIKFIYKLLATNTYFISTNYFFIINNFNF